MDCKPVQDFFLFLVGGSLFAAGVFLFANQVMVYSGYRALGWGRSYGGGFGSAFGGLFSFGAGQGFGLLMVPFGIGVALLLADAYRRLGWFLVWTASAALGVGVLNTLMFSFRATSLWNLFAMIVMIGAGGGLMFRSLRGYDEPNKSVSGHEPGAGARDLKDLREDLEELKKQIRRNGPSD